MSRNASLTRETSASFQAVEDWLRSLGLLHYAQSFYDNGYEDIETCKLMKEQDLNVIDIKNDQDRTDILSAIRKLQQNLYFELEPEEKMHEQTKIDAVALKSKLKECLERENILLTEPPYYNSKDGIVGDLYPLAIRYSRELSTFFNDVLDALEQLQKRQLPTQNYDIMVTETTNPAEYLNCETPGCKRSSSFSKYDTRVTKSTTDLTKDNLNTSGESPKMKKQSKKGFLGGVFKRNTAISRSMHGAHPPSHPIILQDFKASELQLSQDEIKTIFHQIKTGEISQEDALDVIKRRGLNKSTSYDGSPECSPKYAEGGVHKDPSLIGKPKSRSMKDPLRNRCPSAQFYTKGDDLSRSSTSLISNGSKSSLEISGDHSGISVDDDSSSIGSKHSPEINKAAPGLFKKIRSSMRKKRPNGEESPSEERKESLLTNGACLMDDDVRIEEVLIKPTHDTDSLFFTPVSCNQTTASTASLPELSPPKLIHSNLTTQTTVLVPPPPNTPPPPPPVEYTSDELPADDDFRNRTPSLKIRSFPMAQEEITKRRALEKNNNIPKNDVAIVDSNSDAGVSTSTPSSQAQCNQGMAPELNKVFPKIPPRPAPRRTPSEELESLPTVPPRRSKVFRAELTERQMDELVKEMNDIEADLDSHLAHVSTDDEITRSELDSSNNGLKKVESMRKTKPPHVPVKSSFVAGSKKPVPPPRPSMSGAEDSSSSIGSDTSSIGSRSPCISSLPRRQCPGKGKVSDLVTNRQWVSKKIQRENINLSLLPYTSKSGCWCIPYNLVMRYADDLALPINEVIRCFEEIRSDERKRMHQPLVPYTDKELGVEKPCPMTTLDEFLVHIGLPMYTEDFREVGITNVTELNQLDECDVKRIGLFDQSHVTWFLDRVRCLLS